MKTSSALVKLGSLLLLGLACFMPTAHALIWATVSATPGTVSPGGSISISASGHCDQEPLSGLYVTSDKGYSASVTGGTILDNDLFLSGTDTAPGTVGTVTYNVTADSVNFTASGSTAVTVVASNTAPFGVFEDCTASLNQNLTLLANGWAADNEDGAPVTTVKIYLDGNFLTNAVLGGSRPDVATSYSRSDYTYSGWNLTWNIGTLAPGTHTLTAYAIDSQSVQATLGSKSFVVYTIPLVNGATWNSLNAPASVYANASFSVTANATNTGTKNWGAQHYLVLKDSGNNALSSFSANGVNAGASTTANWPVTAPATPGSYTYYYQALENGVESFGPNNSLTVSVVVAPGVTITADNATLNPGDTTTIRANFSTDTAHGDAQLETAIKIKGPKGSWLDS